MVVVRDIFQIDPSSMKEAKDLAKRNREFAKRLGAPPSRVLTDLTGDYYTLVLEAEYPSLCEYESTLNKLFADKEWQAFYPKLREKIRGGRREVYTLVD